MGQTRNPRRHCLSALSPLDVFIYAPRGEITKSTGVSLPLPQTEDFVFSLTGTQNCVPVPLFQFIPR